MDSKQYKSWNSKISRINLENIWSFRSDIGLLVIHQKNNIQKGTIWWLNFVKIADFCSWCYYECGKVAYGLGEDVFHSYPNNVLVFRLDKELSALKEPPSGQYFLKAEIRFYLLATIKLLRTDFLWWVFLETPEKS